MASSSTPRDVPASSNGHDEDVTARLRALLAQHEAIAARHESIAKAIRTVLDWTEPNQDAAGLVDAAVTAGVAAAVADNGARRRRVRDVSRGGKTRRAEVQAIMDSFNPGDPVPANTFARIGPYLRTGYLKRNKAGAYFRTDKAYEA